MNHLIKHIAAEDEETIAAVSTSIGEGGIGIIRISGPLALAIGLQLFRKHDGSRIVAPESHRQYYGVITSSESGIIIDEVLFCVMHAPHSYTRDDVVEISGHGGPMPLNTILRQVCEHGARLAHPGEFTQRAFLNGRIDLTQAEAVLDTIHAKTEAGLRAAQRQLRGDVGKQIYRLHARVVTLLASVEAAIDFSDDDISFLSPLEIEAIVREVQQEINSLIISYQCGKVLREGIRTVIIGRPNVGKSSLLNCLLGESRAIVTEIPGTTRDVIEEQIDIAGIPLRLYDTAGIRQTQDTIEKIGVERSHIALQEADLILFLLDRSEPLKEEDITLCNLVNDRPVIVIFNKVDLPAQMTASELLRWHFEPPVEISTINKIGLRTLEQTIHRRCLGDAVSSESPSLTNLRQLEAAQRAAEALHLVLSTLQVQGSEELLAVDLMAAATALGEIIGTDIRDNVFQELFSRFCVGK